MALKIGNVQRYVPNESIRESESSILASDSTYFSCRLMSFLRARSGEQSPVNKMNIKKNEIRVKQRNLPICLACVIYMRLNNISSCAVFSSCDSL